MLFRSGGGLYASNSNEINYLITASELESFYQFSDKGISIGIFEEQLKSPGKYSCIKSLSSQLYVMASIYAQQNNFDEVVILNHEGNCIEGNTSNLFLIKDDSIVTPPITDGCVDGVFRNYLIDLLQKENYNVKIESISHDRIANADELFFCNAIKGIRWTQSIEGNNYQNKKTKDIYDLLLKNS